MSDEAMVGLEKSRRAGWAVVFKLRADNRKLLDLNFVLLKKLAGLALLVMESEWAQCADEGDPLVARARTILATLRRTARGDAALRQVLKERGDG